MSQLNIHMTPSFEKNLQKLMHILHIKTKAEAIRYAIKETLNHSLIHAKPGDFSKWIGLGKQVPVNANSQFKSDDDLWK